MIQNENSETTIPMSALFFSLDTDLDLENFNAIMFAAQIHVTYNSQHYIIYSVDTVTHIDSHIYTLE